jgi:hypothetical protein
MMIPQRNSLALVHMTLSGNFDNNPASTNYLTVQSIRNTIRVAVTNNYVVSNLLYNNNTSPLLANISSVTPLFRFFGMNQLTSLSLSIKQTEIFTYSSGS